MRSFRVAMLTPVLVALLGAQPTSNSGSAPIARQVRSRQIDLFWNTPIIFVAEIESAAPAEDCQTAQMSVNSCGTEVVAHVTEVLKNVGEQLGPDKFTAIVPSTLGFATLQSNRWKFRRLPMQAGQRYLIFSGQHEELRTAFTSPQSFILITDLDDPISDVHHILRWREAPPEEQAWRASMAISHGSGRRSLLFASYVNGLIANGSDADAKTLVQTLKTSDPSRFSNQARAGLLRRPDAGRGQATAVQLRLFVVLTARYLIDAPEQDEPGELGASVVSLLPNVSWILGSEAAAALPGALPERELTHLRKRISNLSISRLLTPQQLISLQRFADAISSL